MEHRHVQCCVTPLAKLFNLSERECQFDPIYNISRTTINIYSYMISEETNLINKMFVTFAYY